jgi:hypothetical protein
LLGRAPPPEGEERGKAQEHLHRGAEACKKGREKMTGQSIKMSCDHKIKSSVKSSQQFEFNLDF